VEARLDRLISDGHTFTPQNYENEKNFEGLIVRFAEQIFGQSSVYIDVKKRIGKTILSIPDGYLIDFSFPRDPRLYIIENELARHDPYKHIGQQLLKFSVSYKASGREIKAFLLKTILADPRKERQVDAGLREAGYRNIDAFLETIILERPVAAIIVIDENTPELESVLSELTMKTDIVEFRTYARNSEVIHRFTPFQAEIREESGTSGHHIDIEALDTIVVPARKEGFERSFVGKNYWFDVRMSSVMVERLKYIAAYQTAPISAITHYAEIARIEKSRESAKYTLYFQDPAKPIGPIRQSKQRKVIPQAPRYTTLDRLLKAKTMDQVFED
jgi:hypothetical protein